MSPNRDRLADTDRGHWGFDDDKPFLQLTEDITAAAAALRPEFLVLGVEVNYLALELPDQFRALVAKLPVLVRRVEKQSPATRCLVSFQYELLLGNHGDAVGSHRGAAHLDVVAAFGDLFGLIGLSLYPYYAFARPQAIPANYLDPALGFGKGIAVLETGWPTSQSNAERDQEEYVRWLLGEAEDSRVEAVLWTTSIDTRPLHPGVDASESLAASGWPASAFHLGLWRHDGEPKPGAIDWMSRFARPYHISGKGQTGSGP